MTKKERIKQLETECDELVEAHDRLRSKLIEVAKLLVAEREYSRKVEGQLRLYQHATLLWTGYASTSSSSTQPPWPRSED